MSQMDIAIRNGKVYRDSEFIECSIGIEGTRIEKIGGVETAGREIDASGCYVVPGMVNTHTHSPMTLLRGLADGFPVREWLEEEVKPLEKKMLPEDVYNGTRLAIVEMLQSGTTTFGEIYFDAPAILSAVSESGIRARIGYGMSNIDKSRRASEEQLSNAADFVTHARETYESHIKPMLTPHAIYTCDDWFLERIAETAASLDCPVHTHLSESVETVEETLDEHGYRPVKYLDTLDFWEPDAYVAHAIHLDESEMAILGNEEVGVAHCPSANAKLRSGVCPVTDLKQVGVPVSLSTDGPASNNNLDMLEELKFAALLARTRSTHSILESQEVLEMATRFGAEVLGLETGKIEPGFRADLVLLDGESSPLIPPHDPVSNIVFSANRESVRTVLVDGNVLIENNELLAFDATDVYAAAKESSRRLFGS